MIFDLHNDFPTSIDIADYGAYLASAKHDAVVTQVIWSSGNGEFYDRYYEIFAALDKSLPRAIENIGFLDERKDLLETFDFSDYIYCSLTWNNNNAFAGGAIDDGVLTQKGKLAIKAMERGGAAVDVAHLNKRSFYDVVDSASRIICSHTGFNNHVRSLGDDQIRILIERNAVIGLCTVQAFTDARSADEWALTIDRFVQKYGDSNIAVGTDFYGSKDIPQDLTDYRGFDRVFDVLKARGYSDASLSKIFYDNANTFFYGDT